MNRRSIPAVILVLTAALGLAGRIAAYPGGTPRVVTNAGPWCTNCHSSSTADQLRDMTADAIPNMLPDKRHYAAISAGEEGYGKMTPEDREKLLTAVKAMDANSHIDIALSAAKVKPRGLLTVTVTTHGGAGPVLGVMLTDNDLRYQSSPIQVEGFLITAAPAVTGPDGKPQTKFMDARLADLPKGINYVNIQDVKGDGDTGVYPECKVVYTLKAPPEKGVYTISAAFLFGTEKGSAVGRVEAPGGRIMPVGGQGSHSGRVQFAKLVKITVG